MKKIFLMAAFAGLLGSAAVANTTGDDKDKAKKECCKKGEAKACCKKDGASGKACAKDAASKETKACCKKDKAAATKETAVEEKK